MKILICALALTTLSVAIPQRSPTEETMPAWVTAVSYDLPEDLIRPPQDYGRMGACAVAFWVGPHRAGAIIDLIEGRGIGVFITVAASDAKRGDMKVVFEDDQGEEHIVGPDASVDGYCILFRSPEDMPAARFAKLRVVYDDRAPWIR